MTASTQTVEGIPNLERALGMFGRRRRSGNEKYGVTVPFVFTVTVPTTATDEADDKLRIAKLPPGCFVGDLAVRFVAAADAHATPTLVNDFILENDAGTAEDIKLIGGSTAGQAAGGADRIDDAAVGLWGGGLWLTMETTTGAATATEVTLRVYLLLSYGVVTENVARVPHFQEV